MIHKIYHLQEVGQIIVMHKGRIVEEGTPTELMLLKGRYQKTFEVQS